MICGFYGMNGQQDVDVGWYDISGEFTLIPNPKKTEINLKHPNLE